MNKQDRKVLACVDQSHFADTVADYAAWAARRMETPLELLHVIDRHLERGSPLRALIFGSKTTDLLRAATIPTLLLR